MTPVYFWLAATLLLTALLWIPYVLQMIAEIGLVKALTEGGGTVTPKAPWAARLKKAHANAVENLVVFAPLVLIVASLGLQIPLAGQLAMVYFFARLVHAVVFTLGIPTVRTLAFATGVVCQVWLALIILGVA